MPAAFNVAAEGPDIYRNFVIPTGLTDDKWVRAVEFRPSARKVVHHALFSYIPGGAVKAVANADGQARLSRFGMPLAMIPGLRRLAISADGPSARRPGFCRGPRTPHRQGIRFHPAAALPPDGKPDTEKTIVGLYFSGRARRRLMTPSIPGFFGLLAGIDIPAGERHSHQGRGHGARRHARAIGTAHAHYLGKDIKATATLPDGR